jgi:hypothetical protein
MSPQNTQSAARRIEQDPVGLFSQEFNAFRAFDYLRLNRFYPCPAGSFFQFFQFPAFHIHT